MGYRTKTGRPFGKNSLHEILRNPKYANCYVYNRSAAKDASGRRNSHASKAPGDVIAIKGVVPAIVSEEDFREVQVMMQARKKQKRPRDRGASPYLLTGKIVCGLCGGAMVGNSGTAKNGRYKYYYYECNNAARTGTCANRLIRKEVLEAFVLEQIREKIFAPEATPELAREVVAYARLKAARRSAEEERLKKALAAIQGETDNLLDLAAKGRARAMLDAVHERLEQLGREKEALQQELRKLDDLEELNLTEDMVLAYLADSRRVLEEASPRACRTLIEHYVREIKVGPEAVQLVLKIELPRGLCISDKLVELGGFEPPTS